GVGGGMSVETSGLRRIWLCADDYGISPAVSTGIRDLVARGRLNAVSVLVAAPTFQRSEAVSLNVLNSAASRAAIGLHIALTAPFRPSRADFAPASEGAFLPIAATFRHALFGRFKQDALVAEIAEQMRTFADSFGRAPDFVDGHQHVHLFPRIRDAVLEVAKEMAPQAWVRQCGRVAPFAVRIADGKGLFLDFMSRRFRRRAAALGLATNPAFAGTYEFDEKADFAALFPRFLEELPDGGVVMCHPGFVDAELERLDPLTRLREKEYAFFADEEFPALLARHGVTLA